MMLRIFTNIVLLFSILFFPWWVTAVLALAALFLFKSFYEIILWGLVGDLLYGAHTTLFRSFESLLGLGAFFLFAAVYYMRKEIRLYTRS